MSSHRKTKKLLGRELCPCDSGKKYMDCCWGKDFDWVKDDKGEIFKRVKLTKEVDEVLENEKKEFIEIFGREPIENDPLMPHFLMEAIDESVDGIGDAMEEAGISEELIYAFRKTGFIVSENNLNLFTDKELREWNDAVKEYARLKKSKKGIRNSKGALFGAFEKIHYIIGIVIWKRNKWKSEILPLHPSDYVFFCLTKNLKTFRASTALLGNKLGEDALALVRSMFENYLEILGILNSTGELIDSIKANIGFREGKFMIDPKDWRYLIEVETNRKVKRNISVKSLAKNSPFAEDLVIYEYLYSWLSQYVHPDIFTMPAYVGKEGFDYFKNNFGFETIFFSTYVNALILQTILLVEDLDDLSRRDIEVYLQSTIPTLITVISDIKENNPEIPDELTSRLKRVAPSASD